MSLRAFFFLATLLLCCKAGFSSIISVDLGSEYLKVCLVKPGKTPISVVSNEMSRRKSPSLVGVVDDNRLLGEEALSFSVRYPSNIVARARDLLGRDGDDPALIELFEKQLLPYKIVSDPATGSAAISIGDNDVITAEELVASLLQYTKQIAEAQAGSPVHDVVLTVPSFWGQRQRQALISAAGLADLRVLGLINGHAAAALQYGIERDFTNKTEHVIFYDMGSGSAETALVRYSSYGAKEGGRTKQINQLEVLDVDYATDVGANELDVVLAHHFAGKFAASQGMAGGAAELLADLKAAAKLRRQVRRTKEILSANTAAPLSVEELYQGKDFQSSITRVEFEELAADFFDRAVRPLRRLLDRSGLSPASLHAVEVIGGGSRVPRLQAALSAAIGGRLLDRHLDADEAAVHGAALFAANLSSSFRLRRFGLSDLTPFGFEIRVGSKDTGAAEPVPVRLFTPGSKVPRRRVVRVDSPSSDPVSFEVRYNESSPLGLPIDVKEPALARFSVGGFRALEQKYGNSSSLLLRFELDPSGILRLDKVDATVEYEQEETVVTVNATKPVVTDAAEEVAGDEKSEGAKDDADAKATEANDAPAAPTTTVLKKRTIVSPMTVSGGWLRAAAAAPESSRARLAKWLGAEALRREVAQAKNDLEAFVINTKEALETDEDVMAVSTEEEREAFFQRLIEQEDWLYMEADDDAGPKAFRDRLAELRRTGDRIQSRAQEMKRRPVVIEKLRKAAEQKLGTIKGWSTAKPWISDSDMSTSVMAVLEFQSLIDKKLDEQNTRKLTEDPAFLVSELEDAFTKVAVQVDRINATKKPKPAEPKESDSNGDASDEKAGKGANAEKETENTEKEPEREKENRKGGRQNGNGKGKGRPGKERPSSQNKNKKTEL